jgi:glutaredoxin
VSFVYVDAGGALQTVAAREEVPPEAREHVRVDDPALRRTDRTRDLVYVADLREERPDGDYPYQVVTRRRFEELVLPETSEVRLPFVYERGTEEDAPRQAAKPKGARRPAAKVELVRGPGAGAPRGHRVTLYATPWCPACTRARAYLAQRGQAYVEKDIEKDAAAADEYARKCARIGAPPGRVPGIDVDGRLTIGFAPGRLSALLR